MKYTLRHMTIRLMAGVVFGTLGTIALAGDDEREYGVIQDVSGDHQQIVIDKHYYRLDRRTRVHGEDASMAMSVEDLNPGIRIAFRTADHAKRGSILPQIEEIWIYMD